MLAALAFSTAALRADLREHRPTLPYRDAAEWIRANTRPGEVVFSSEWGANSILFYHLRDRRYLVMLDPYFMKAYSEEKLLTWWKLSKGRLDKPAETIAREFDSRVVFLPPRAKALAGPLLMDPDAELEVEGRDGEMVFLLNTARRKDDPSGR
jgi:hypothetical protein